MIDATHHEKKPERPDSSACADKEKLSEGTEFIIFWLQESFFFSSFQECFELQIFTSEAFDVVREVKGKIIFMLWNYKQDLMCIIQKTFMNRNAWCCVICIYRVWGRSLRAKHFMEILLDSAIIILM